MTFILLTGAGFSYNWGGPLASDVFSALLADTSLDTHTRDLLFDSGGAFEKVLTDLQVSPDADDQKRHDALITAVAGIFNGMNNTFMHVPFEFEKPKGGNPNLSGNGLQDRVSLPWPSVTCPYFRRYGMGGLQPTRPPARLGVAHVPGTPAAVVTLARSTKAMTR